MPKAKKIGLVENYDPIQYFRSGKWQQSQISTPGVQTLSVDNLLSLNLIEIFLPPFHLVRHRLILSS